jgi:hypothetical protein
VRVGDGVSEGDMVAEAVAVGWMGVLNVLDGMAVMGTETGACAEQATRN